jgi:hypothetical protein
MADFFLIQPRISPAPDGSTVNPVDDYAIWLRCAGLPNSYGSLANVIADSNAMEVLCNNLNALRYMVRSEDVIMPSVLADSDWIAELDACAYAVTIPTMTANDAPSGTASASASVLPYDAWQAFNKDATWPSAWAITNGSHTGWLQYQFTKNVRVYRGRIQGSVNTWRMWKTVQMQSSSNGSSFTNMTSVINVINSTTVPTDFVISDNADVAYWRLNCLSDYNDVDGAILHELYLYGLDLS